MVECLTQDRGFEPYQRHCVVSLSKNINPSLVLVQPRKTRPFITERLLMGVKNKTNKSKYRTSPSKVKKLLSQREYHCFTRKKMTLETWDQSNDNGAVI